MGEESGSLVLVCVVSPELNDVNFVTGLAVFGKDPLALVPRCQLNAVEFMICGCIQLP